MPTAIIIDDTARDRELLRERLIAHPDISVVAECASGAEGIAAIAHHRPELIFLDVEMPAMSGLEMLAKVQTRDFGAVFISAFNEYAQQAIRMAALDYLIKPVQAHELAEAIGRFRQHTDLRTRAEQYRVLETHLHSAAATKRPLAVPVGGADSRTLEFIDVEDVAYCASAGATGERGAYCTLFLKDGRRLVVSEVLNHYEKLFRPYGFVRISRAHIINPAYMVRYEARDKCVTLRLRNGDVSLTVKDSYRSGFEGGMLR